jgi:class 3 adenylate cyclase
MSQLPTGTVTFLLTDIEGSTQLWEQHPESMRLALARHEALLHDSIDAHGGIVFKGMGDAVFAVFPSAPDALAAALASQRRLAAEPWGEIGTLKIRIAIHTGDAELRTGDYFGPTLNRVARLLGTGAGGQILLSRPSYDLVRDRLPEGTTLRDLGEHRLRGLLRPEHVFQLVSPDLPTEFPPLKSLDPRLNNLPVQLTSFIGRNSVVEAV